MKFFFFLIRMNWYLVMSDYVLTLDEFLGSKGALAMFHRITTFFCKKG
jgi:hypothetical protein